MPIYLGASLTPATMDFDDEVSISERSGLEERVTRLENELAALKYAFEKLMKELTVTIVHFSSC